MTLPSKMIEAASCAINLRSRGMSLADEFTPHAQDALAAAGMPQAIACVEASRRYLQLLQQPGEELNDAFERVAELFRQETGYLRPGKDCRLHDPKIRFEAWEQWVRERREAVQSSIAAYDALGFDK